MPHPDIPDPVPLIDAIERAHDGPPPPLTLAVARAGGIDLWHRAMADAARDRIRRDCAEARLATARRRAMLTADEAPGDAWLSRLTIRLAAARSALAV